MSRAIVVGSTRNFIDEVCSLIATGSTDFGSTMIVFPGRRPRYFVLRSLARTMHSAFIPPRIFSLDSFVEFLHGGGDAEPRPQMSDIDAVALLYSLHQRQPSAYGGEHYRQFPAFYPLGRKLFREFEDLCEGGVTAAGFHAAVLSGGRRELEPVAELFGQFYETLRERGLSTRAMRYDLVCRKTTALPIEQETALIIAGVHCTTRSVEGLLRRLLAYPHAQLVLQEGPQCSETIRTLGLEVEYRKGPDRRPAVSMAHGTDCHAQVFGASAGIERLQRTTDVPDEETVFVLPDAGSLFPVLHHLLPLYPAGQFNISMGYPVTRTPVYGFLESLMKLISGAEDGRMYAPDYLRFCLHPFTKNIRWRDRDDVTRIMFHTIERAFVGSKAKRFFTLHDLENDTALLESCVLSGAGLSAGDVREHLVSIHANTIGALGQPASVGDFAERVLRVLAYVSEESSAHRHWLYATFVSTLTATLGEIGSSSLRTMTLRSPSEYFRFLRSALETERVPFQGTPLEGVQVLGLPETNCLSFRRVVLFDANDDVVPGSPKHYVISPGLRSMLGLPSAADEERAVDQNIGSLVGGADEVLFYYTSKGRREKSRYLERMIWEREKEGDPLSAGILQYATHLDTQTPQPIPKDSGVLDTIRGLTLSASALDTYLHCGIQFYYRYILHLQEKGDMSADIERSDIGSFVHHVLASYFRPAVGRVMTEGDVDGQRLGELIDAEFTAEYGDESISGRFLLKHQIKRHLNDFMEFYQIPVIREHHPHLEGLEGRWQGSLGSMKVTGFIDRIERRGEKAYILDYKTGTRLESLRINFRTLDANDRSTWSGAIGSFQLPLYLLLYHRATGVPREKIVPAYLMLGRNRLGMEIEKPLVEHGVDAGGVIEDIMMALVGEIQSPDHPFLPTEDVTTYCTRCPFTTICGTRWAEAPRYA